jgi:transposase
MTARCVEWIRTQCLRDTFLHVAEHVGCAEKTVRNIAYEYIVELGKKHTPYMPEWLGIDETALNGAIDGNCCVLVDIDKHRPIDVLPNREKETVIKWLGSLGCGSKLRGVSMDMYRPYKQAVATAFPKIPVPVVIDRYHVVRMANAALDKVRIALAKSRKKKIALQWKRDKKLLRIREYALWPDERLIVESWLSAEPELATAYRLKEAFCNIYGLRDKREAEIALDAWRASVTGDMRAPFKDLLSATKNWRTEILAFFDNRQTNAYTEGFNSVIKAVNRMGRGYTFEVLRARLLFGPGSKLSQSKRIRENKAAAARLAPDVGYVALCYTCGGVFDNEQLRLWSPKPGYSYKVSRLGDELLCSSCYPKFDQYMENLVPIPVELDAEVLAYLDGPHPGGCDSCGRFVDEQELEFCKSLPAVFDKQEMQFRQPLPGDSADTIQLLESAILCPSCYRRLNPAHFSQALMNNDSAISPKESVVDHDVQTGFSPKESEEPKGGLANPSCNGSGEQLQTLTNSAPPRKCGPVLARDLRRAFLGLPPGELLPLPRPPRHRRRRWKKAEPLPQTAGVNMSYPVEAQGIGNTDDTVLMNN